MKPGIFRTTVSLNLFEKEDCRELGTQVLHGRYVHVLAMADDEDQGKLLKVQLCEDGYPGYLRFGEYLKKALIPGRFKPNPRFNRRKILAALPNVLGFLFEAMQRPNTYLWGGTIGPNFDCSGLVQAAFASQGIWLPRNARDQCAFTSKNRIPLNKAEPGDLFFFSLRDQVDHVGIHLGNRFFIHSSGLTFGRNGIGIDRLSEQGRVATNYYAAYYSCHRVCSSWPV
jgi:hypothetical protein